jgi:hypothetical protein
MSRRLFHEDVRSRLQRGDRRQRVPMVGSGDNHHLRLVLIEQFAEILERPGLIAGQVLDLVGRHLERRRIDVAQRGDLATS